MRDEGCRECAIGRGQSKEAERRAAQKIQARADEARRQAKGSRRIDSIKACYDIIANGRARVPSVPKLLFLRQL